MPKISGDDATFYVDEDHDLSTVPDNVRLVGPGAPSDDDEVPVTDEEPVTDEDLEPEDEDEDDSEGGKVTLDLNLK